MASVVVVWSSIYNCLLYKGSKQRFSLSSAATEQHADVLLLSCCSPASAPSSPTPFALFPSCLLIQSLRIVIRHWSAPLPWMNAYIRWAYIASLLLHLKWDNLPVLFHWIQKLLALLWFYLASFVANQATVIAEIPFFVCLFTLYTSVLLLIINLLIDCFMSCALMHWHRKLSTNNNNWFGYLAFQRGAFTTAYLPSRLTLQVTHK
jgi:hypothetical protein